jgi:hypothetical protein
MLQSQNIKRETVRKKDEIVFDSQITSK